MDTLVHHYKVTGSFSYNHTYSNSAGQFWIHALIKLIQVYFLMLNFICVLSFLNISAPFWNFCKLSQNI